ncbi:precorrin-3B C(17)-methyltransferase [Tumidithrix elongata RA019]|uniref:Precorrin-3B C(17)-methyltransferase n=1 Tax=Tumidithrix elongata BACA0141 TaxID=2716417 RepID=A0AAW9PRV5_9CYAN|nr:precorrin-3B C(17)-methyltransferase [Tumidithrix elongata RA019]
MKPSDPVFPTLAVVVLGQNSVPTARQFMAALPNSILYGLVGRTEGVDISFSDFGETLRELFAKGTPIVGICAAGILIRTLAPLLTDKRSEPPVLAVAEDGSAVVPLLGGLHGVNDLARQIADALGIEPAITTTGDIRFRTTLLNPPQGYRLANPEDAKKFIADLLAGATLRLEGEAPWLRQSKLPITDDGELLIRVTEEIVPPTPNCLVYHPTNGATASRGKLTIVGTGPGKPEWMSPEVKAVLRSATDWVGYKFYLDLAGSLHAGQQRHDSDNREELDRARFALDLAATGKSVAVVSSGDPGIFAMAAAVFEVLEQEAKPEWEPIDIRVEPGISAMQAAAAQVGAPLGHDFCAISLSDLLKPWSVIEQRIAAVAEADFAIAFYNPVSKQRTWQLGKAKEILLQRRSPETPVVLARNLGRPKQAVQVCTLGNFKPEDADMRTLIIIGSSQTRTISRKDGKVWVYTPRRYDPPRSP